MVDNFFLVCFFSPLVGESAGLLMGDLFEEVLLMDVSSAKFFGEKSRRFCGVLESISTPSTVLEVLFILSLSLLTPAESKSRSWTPNSFCILSKSTMACSFFCGCSPKVILRLGSFLGDMLKSPSKSWSDLGDFSGVF